MIIHNSQVTTLLHVYQTTSLLRFFMTALGVVEGNLFLQDTIHQGQNALNAHTVQSSSHLIRYWKNICMRFYSGARFISANHVGQTWNWRWFLISKYLFWRDLAQIIVHFMVDIKQEGRSFVSRYKTFYSSMFIIFSSNTKRIFIQWIFLVCIPLSSLVWWGKICSTWCCKFQLMAATHQVSDAMNAFQ